IYDRDKRPAALVANVPALARRHAIDLALDGEQRQRQRNRQSRWSGYGSPGIGEARAAKRAARREVSARERMRARSTLVRERRRAVSRARALIASASTRVVLPRSK